MLESEERKEVRMARKRFTPEQIIIVRLSQGEKVTGSCLGLGITPQVQKPPTR